MLTHIELEKELRWLEARFGADAPDAEAIASFEAVARRLQGCALCSELAFLDSALAMLRRRHGLPPVSDADGQDAPPGAAREAKRPFPIG